MLKQVPDLIRLGCYRTVWQFTKRYLKDERLRRAFSIQPLLVGGNPFSTTSIYSLIHYLERRWGVHFPRGGTGALVQALGKLMLGKALMFVLGRVLPKFKLRTVVPRVSPWRTGLCYPPTELSAMVIRPIPTKT